jgi:VWFA-related protein
MTISFRYFLGSVLSLATFAAAQSTPPAQTPQPASQPANSPAASQLQSRPPVTPTIHSAAKLVVVDVTVSDKHGNPVHDLKKDDFTVLENGNPQAVHTFEEHVALSAADAVKFPPMPQMPPGVFTNITPAPVNSAINIILIDTLNTPIDDQSYLRSQLVNYINHATPGVSIAIFALTTHLTMLQGFTSDMDVLKRIVSKEAGKTSPLMARTQTGEDSSNITAGSVVGGAATAMAEFTAFQSTTVQGDPQNYQRALITLQAFDILARYLGNIHGRKNLVWFSGSFPLDLQPNDAIVENGVNSFAGSNNETEVHRIINLLARGQVAVYPVDCRGVQASPTLSGEYQGSTGTGGNPSAFLGDKSSFEHNMATEHSTMERLASNTGGRAILNENDLTKATAEAIQIGSNYYTVSYIPSNTDWKGDFRKIAVKLDKQGYTLAYRRGYYADDPNSPQNQVDATTLATGKNAGKKGPPTQDNGRIVRAAMVHGAPGSTEILYKVRVLPTGEPEDLVAPGNVLSPFGLKKAAGRFDRYVVDFDADATDMLFPPKPDGGYDCRVEFVVQVYQNSDGQLVNTSSSTLAATLTLAQRNKLIRYGFPFHQEVSVPLNGDYSLRIGVHDFNSDHIGAVEVPVASVKNLPPSQYTPAAAKSGPKPLNSSH